MAAIKLLPDTLISQIAAGEVVERPASVLKELIENSIDAGATVCDIELEQGGLKTIAVRDNGSGMSPEDAVLSFARHATSKIKTFEDLVSIGSFGFRGEALAAVSSVAHVTMKTREQGSDVGTEIVFQGGLKISQGVTGCAPGTEIVVRNLFFNTPARKKFLKTETTELQHCVMLVTTIALAYPSVAFSLSHNGRELLHIAATEDYLIRIGQLLGDQFMRESTPVEFVTPSISIQGFIGKPGMTLSSKRHQYLFVNGRAVTDTSIAYAVSDGYGSRLPARTYPMFVLFIDIDPKEVDVNVHPRKLQVKFSEPGRIYRDTLQAVKGSLDRALTERTLEPVRPFVRTSDVAPALEVEQPTLSLAQPVTLDIPYERSHRAHLLSQATPIAQIENSYILIHDASGLIIVDQHAAHERIQYERFKSQYEEKNQTNQLTVQRFLVPLTLELSPHERAAYEKIEPVLTAMGFLFAEWSGGSLVIEAAPSAFRESEMVRMVKSLFAEMSEEDAPAGVLPERLLKSLACKAAVKFGMPLSTAEQAALLSELDHTQNNATCPHGRPTRIDLTFEELERRFYRRK